MAKASKSVSFTKATINTEDMTITEYLKDETNVFNLIEVLQEWNNVENISITLKKDANLDSPE